MEQRNTQRLQTTLATALIAGALMASTAFAQGTPGGTNPSTQSPSGMGSTPGADTNRGTASNGMTPDRTPQVSVPGKAELAPSAFGKLDANRRGYVTREDTTQLNGFDNAFQQADANKDGRLSQDEFNRAWNLYSNQK